MQTHEELQQFFPDLQPIKKPPGLFSLNGIGTGMYGKRDQHPETGAYLKTRCVCFVFIPIIALGAYRVIDADSGGWYFLGREPLSGFAKRWNMFFVFSLLVIASLGTYSDITRSPDYRAKQLIQKAAAAEGKKQIDEALRLYEHAARLKSTRKAVARAAQQRLITQQLPHLDAAQAGRCFAFLGHKLPEQLRRRYPGLLNVGLGLAKRLETSSPATSLQILDVLTKVADTPGLSRKVWRQELVLLERLHKQKPSDAKVASRLAVLYEKSEACKRCQALLQPLEKTLGTLEGARILGEWYAKKQQLEQAHRLLQPYVNKHLIALHKAEAAYNQITLSVRRQIFEDLKRHRGPRAFYRRSFKNLPKKERTLRILRYVQKRMRDSGQIAKRRQALRETASVVPVAMGLGIIKLQRARSLRNPVQQRKELRGAEKVFLSIRGIAGRSTQFKLYLGQVYYWLGRQDKGKKLFDELLRKTHRAPLQLVRLARILREVGDRTEARNMAEEAYKSAKQDDLKSEAASIRALTSLAIADKIKWLRLSDTGNPAIAALLNSTLGNQVWQQGKPKAAAIYYRKAIKAYEAMDKNPASLNNHALVYFSLFQATSDRKAFAQGIALIKEAVALRPSDSILLYNAADAMLRAALLDTVRRSFSPSQLQLQIRLNLLTHLYDKEAQRSALIAKFADLPTLQKAIELYRKVLLLSPNNAFAYDNLASLYNTMRDAKGMKALEQLLAKARINNADNDKEIKLLYQGARSLRYRISFGKELRQRRKLLALLRKRKQTRKAAIVAANMVYTHIALAMFGGRVQAAKVVELAEQSYRDARSSFSRKSLISALFFRVAQQLSRKNAAFRRIWHYSRRASTPYSVVVAVIQEDPTLRKELQAWPEIKRITALMRAHAEALPQRHTVLEWAFLTIMAPTMAQQLTASIKDDQTGQGYRRVLGKLHPYRASYALDLYLEALALGQTDRARTLRKQFAKRGIPLPFATFLPDQVQQVR